MSSFSTFSRSAEKQRKAEPYFFVLMLNVVFVSTYFSWSERKHFTEHKQCSLDTKLFNRRSNWLMSVTKSNQREMVAFMGYLA